LKVRRVQVPSEADYYVARFGKVAAQK